MAKTKARKGQTEPVWVERWPGESAFQDAIDRNICDQTNRMAFTDWLRERDDERADGYAAMARLNVYPDPFWGVPYTSWSTPRPPPTHNLNSTLASDPEHGENDIPDKSCVYVEWLIEFDKVMATQKRHKWRIPVSRWKRLKGNFLTKIGKCVNPSRRIHEDALALAWIRMTPETRAEVEEVMARWKTRTKEMDDDSE